MSTNIDERIFMKNKLFTILLSGVFVSAFAKSCNYSDVVNCLKPYNSSQMLLTDRKEVENNDFKTDYVATTDTNNDYDVIDFDTSGIANESTNTKEITMQELIRLMTIIAQNQQMLIAQNEALIADKRQIPQITAGDHQNNILMLEDEKSGQSDEVVTLNQNVPLKSNLQIFAEYFYSVTKNMLPVIATVGINVGLYYVNNALFNIIIPYIPGLVKGWVVQKLLYGVIAGGESFVYYQVKYFLSAYTNIKFSSDKYDKFDSAVSVLAMIYRIWHFQPKVETWSEYIGSWREAIYYYFKVWKEVMKEKKSSGGLSEVIVETIPSRKKKSRWFNFKKVFLPNS